LLVSKVRAIAWKGSPSRWKGLAMAWDDVIQLPGLKTNDWNAWYFKEI
jgi:hypothetical protein